jgi:hypothetical protein
LITSIEEFDPVIRGVNLASSVYLVPPTLAASVERSFPCIHCKDPPQGLPDNY